LGSAWFVCAASLAYAEPKGADALRAAADYDELSLAQLAARTGDDVVLTALHAGDDPSLQLAAIRATPHIVDRDQALLPLAEIAAGRDPELAPLAAWKVLRITQELVREHLEVHEIVPSSLAAARAALLAVQADGSARADIRLYAGQAGYLLGTLGVPPK
jgi:hypothetical protein